MNINLLRALLLGWAASSSGSDREPSRLAARRNTPGGLEHQNGWERNRLLWDGYRSGALDAALPRAALTLTQHQARLGHENPLTC
jgi:hypothetical protein